AIQRGRERDNPGTPVSARPSRTWSRPLRTKTPRRAWRPWGGRRGLGFRCRRSGVGSLFFAHGSLKPEKTKEIADQEGFEPPTSGFGDRRSAVRATVLRYEALAGFAVQGMLLVPGTILHNLKAPRSVLLVFDRRVVAPLALGAGEQD